MTRHCDIGVALLSLDILDGNAVILRYDLADALYRYGGGLAAADNVRDGTAAHIQRNGNGCQGGDRASGAYPDKRWTNGIFGFLIHRAASSSLPVALSQFNGDHQQPPSG